MNTKQLKQLIKPIIRETLAELLIEMKIDQIIGEAISRNMKTNVVQEQKYIETPKQKDPRVEQQLLEKRRKMLDSLHAESSKSIPTPKPKNVLEEILQDTEDGGYSIEDGNTNPEFISEDTLGNLTEGKDYSKFF